MWTESLARRLDPAVFRELEESRARLSAMEGELSASRAEAEALRARAASLESEAAALTDEMKAVGVFVWGSGDINEVDRLILTRIHDAGGSVKAGELVRDLGMTKAITQGAMDKLYRRGLLAEVEEDARLSAWARRVMGLSEGYRSLLGVGTAGPKDAAITPAADAPAGALGPGMDGSPAAAPSPDRAPASPGGPGPEPPRLP